MKRTATSLAVTTALLLFLGCGSSDSATENGALPGAGGLGTGGAPSFGGFATGGAASCPAGAALCAGYCTDVTANASNCGACGVVCGVGQACTAGACACAAGQILCNGACVDPFADPANCGTCSSACVAGQSCTAGTCQCAPGLAACGTGCVDTNADGANCGGCGVLCPSGQLCSAGACVASCPAGTVPCGSGCVDLATSLLNCGACSNACAAGRECAGAACQCPAGQSDCAGVCTVTLGSDAANCGACGATCATGQLCSAGTCACAAGQVVCGGACVDPLSDGAHCGACDSPCTGGAACVAGTCSAATGGAGGTGGAATGGVETGGVETGGVETGGAATGGELPGGAGTTTGGAATGGELTGGAVTGGMATGGDPIGGVSTGGVTTGGVGTGGAITGGAPTGGTGGVPCTDTPPPNGDTCVHAVEWNWCGAQWMNGACALSCGLCTGTGGTGGSSTGGAPTGGVPTGGAPTGGATTGGASTGGAPTGGVPTGGAPTGGVSTGGSSTGGSSTCDPGSSTTTWATGCPTSGPTCTAGTWVAGGPDPDHTNFSLIAQSAHFAIYSDEAVSTASANSALDTLENLVWNVYFGNPIYFREPLCNSSTKYKASVHVHSDWGLTGGAWTSNRMGMWIGTGALADHWGLAHEFMHAVQSVSGGMSCNSSNTCGWVYESHANFMPHQLAEYRSSMHCSEMLFNTPHLYLGSTRDRYCNWQFMEYLKDKHCYSAVNAIWTGTPANNPFTGIMNGMGWNVSQLNDFLGEWAMHNVTWDYKNPQPTLPGDTTDPGAAFRAAYGSITDTSRPERRQRITRLEALDGSWATHRRFVSPYYWAPQRWGYNVVRLYPEAGATSVTVSFRGVTQAGANSDWRWGLVATNSGITTSRYSPLQRGADGQVTLCVNPGEALWLVVMGTPSVQQQIVWDQAYPSIYRYPYMVALQGAWPEGFQNGALDACPAGTQRHSNGGGCAPASLAASVYVGPYARVLGGTVSGTARIEDQATILSGATVSGGTVGALAVLNRFNVSGSAIVETTFYPPGFFEAGQGLSGTARLFGDVEYRGANLNKSSGSYYGFVDSGTASQSINDVTVAPPYTWRN